MVVEQPPYWPCELSWWEAFLARHPRPLEDVEALADLHYLIHLQRWHGVRKPGRRSIASRWGWTPDRVRKFLHAHESEARARFAPAWERTDRTDLEIHARSTPDPMKQDPDQDPGSAANLKTPTARPRHAHLGTDGPDRSGNPRPPDAHLTPTPPGEQASNLEDRGGKVPSSSSSSSSDPELFEVRPTTTEQARWLSILSRWTDRWPRRSRPADLAWLTEHVMGRTEFEGLDLVAELDRWETWLEDAACGRTKSGATFPRNPKRALGTWLRNALRYRSDTDTDTEPTRRGQHGSPSRFNVTTDRA